MTAQGTSDGVVPLSSRTARSSGSPSFEVEVLDVREAAPEEVARGRVHGPGGHEHRAVTRAGGR